MKSWKGQIQKNIQNHLRIIKCAINLGAELIVFPELSITGYEPSIAKEFATNIEDSIFDPFQKIANENNIAIGVGMPFFTNEGICISMLIFQPKKEKIVYSKQMLHEDELLYFVPGDKHVLLNVKGKKIAIGICYEALQPAHFLVAKGNGAEIFIASVAKSKVGMEKANLYFPKMAREFKQPVLLSNCIGYSDNFLGIGHSAVWNKEGKLICQLDGKNEGILVYDTEQETVNHSQNPI